MIESARLKIRPLTVDEIRLYMRNDFSFEKYFSLKLHPRTLPENVKKALRERVLTKLEADPGNQLFYTLWVAIDKTINTVVAGIAIKGPPNENGEVEFGAGTLEGFMNRGYMTEATKLLCEWALRNGVKTVVANCSPENIASQRTLEKCGFEVILKDTDNWLWHFQHH